MTRFIAVMAATLLVTTSGVFAATSDEQIAQQIVQRLQEQRKAAKLEHFNIGVQVDKGTVTMMGQVASSEHAMLALDIARRVPGVQLVVNDLHVSQSAAPAPGVANTAAAQPAPAPQATAPSAGNSQPLPYGTASTPTGVQLTGATAGPSGPTGAAAGFVQPTAHPAIGSGVMPSAAAAPRPMPSAAAQAAQAAQASRPSMPRPFAPARPVGHVQPASAVGPEYHAISSQGYGMPGAAPVPSPHGAVGGSGIAQAAYDHPQMPGYAWPSYAAYPNYAALSYPQQYSPAAWPYIGPFYPYPQVPLGWRKVMLEWDDGWWFLDFKSK